MGGRSGLFVWRSMQFIAYIQPARFQLIGIIVIDLQEGASAWDAQPATERPRHLQVRGRGSC